MEDGTVHIIGTGPSLLSYDWPEGVEKWSVGSASKDLIAAGKKIDIFFNMHEWQVPVEGHNNIGLRDYPIIDIISFFRSRYFTSSTSYMIALAIYRGYKKIVLIGFDVEVKSEYEFERPCIAYWIGQADGRGIDIETSNGFCDPIFLYGYDENSLARVRGVINAKVQFSKHKAVIASDAGKKEEMMGHVGKIRAYEIMLSELQGD